jgi:thiol-disulfide isomerase/thioredoxin
MQKLIFLSLLLFSKVALAQIKLGDKAPNINITGWIQNQPKNTLLKDKFIVIDFWATWCAPCLASMSHMNTLVEQNKTKNNLIFLAMSDEAKEKILPVLSRVLFKASVVTDTTHLTQDNFEITSIPNCIIVDDKGFVRWTGNPKELTNDIIQEILAQKKLDIVNNEKNTSGRFAKQYDSLSHEYQRIFNNDSIEEYFSLGPFLSEGYGSKYSRNFTDYLRKVEIGVRLKDIISEQACISSSQISLPADLDSIYTSYCYKSEKRIKNEDVLHSILTAANLASNKKDSIQKVFLIEIKDSNLLNKSFVKNEKTALGHLSVSDNGKFIAMSNNSIFSIISALQDRFNCPIILNDSTVFDKPLDMMLQTNDFATLKESMKLYGLNIKETQQSLPFLRIVHE